MKIPYIQIEARYHIIASLLLARKEKELPRATKVKLMNLRIRLSKPVKRFREEMREARDELIQGEYAGLRETLDAWSEEGKTDEEKACHEADQARLKQLEDRLNDDLNALANIKYAEKEQIDDIRFTAEEFSNILDINSLHEVTFPNGAVVKAADLMEAFYELFVEKAK
jgi:hypothetical protein